MNTTGYYGKLPQRGDFISGRLPSTFKNTWDDWAQQLVTSWRELEQQSGTTQVSWYHLPIYRFYLSSRIAGDNAWIGVMAPSSDSVGRLFPFCMARDINPQTLAHDALTTRTGYFDALEKIIENLYTRQQEFETLNDVLADLDQQVAENQSVQQPPNTRQSSGESICIQLDAAIDSDSEQFWQSASQALLLTSFAGHSVWTTSPLSNSATETLICESLPSVQSCQSFFSGDYTRGHWTSVAGPQSSQISSRQANALVQSQPLTTAAPMEPDDGDTKPIHKLTSEQVPRATDFLELDDTDQTDAPWDD